MADTVKNEWVYPPNFDGGYDNDKTGHKRVVKHLTGFSDGTGETGIKKIDVSDLQMIDGSVPTRFAVESITWDVTGFTAIELYFNRIPSATIAMLSGQGTVDYTKQGGFVDPGGMGNGDIMLTSNGASSGDSYDITIAVRLKT